MIKEFQPELLPTVRELMIQANRRVLARTLSGNWLSTFKGRGMEFSDYRQYSPGDDASMIDWRASLRAHKLLVKEMTEERNLNVFIILDVSNTMLYGSRDILKAELAAQLVSNISYVALRAGDAVSLTTATDKIEEFVSPDIGVRQHSVILNIISKGQNWGGDFDFGHVMGQFMGITKKRGMIIFISDFIGMGEKWRKYLEIAHSRFEMVGLMVRDPRDRRLPEKTGEFILEDPLRDRRIIIDCDTYAEPYRKYVEAEEERIKQMFRMVKGDVLLLETDQDPVHPLMRFFYKHSMQMEH